MIATILDICLVAILCSFTIRSIIKTFNAIQELRIRSFEANKQRFKL